MNFVDASTGQPSANLAVHPVLAKRAISAAAWQRATGLALGALMMRRLTRRTDAA